MQEDLTRTKKTLLDRLARNKKSRQSFVESQLAKDIAYQIRLLRERQSLNQGELAGLCGTSQNAISRLESPSYGKPSITTLKKLADAFDVALIVRFAPFSELVDWVAGIPRMVQGLSTTDSLVPPAFNEDLAQTCQQLAEYQLPAAAQAGTMFSAPSYSQSSFHAPQMLALLGLVGSVEGTRMNRLSRYNAAGTPPVGGLGARGALVPRGSFETADSKPIPHGFANMERHQSVGSLASIGVRQRAEIATQLARPQRRIA